MAPLQAIPDVSLYRQLLAYRERLYDDGLAAGLYSPYVYPWDALPGFYLFFAILLFPRLPKPLVRVLRWPLFMLIVVHCAWVLNNCRSLNFTAGYGIGLSCAWGCIMSMCLILIQDIGSDYSRLEAHPVEEVPKEKMANGVGTSIIVGNGELKQRNQRPKRVSFSTVPDTAIDIKEPETYHLGWQRYPASLSHAVDWSLELMTAFRGTNWNFRSPTLSPLKKQDPTMDNNARLTKKKSSLRFPPTPSLRDIQLQGVYEFITYYIILDCIKTSMVTDPYFMGLAPLTSPSPWPWISHLPPIMIPFATKFIRLLVSLAGVVIALSYIFALSPLFFTIILPAIFSTDVLLKITRSPLLEPQMYEPYFLPSALNPLPHILSHSLSGLWGKYWHQMFRHGITVPGTYLIQKLKLDSRSQTARAIQLLVAFLLTGSIHASASYTTFNPHSDMTPSRPVTGALAFFLSQGCGILLHTFLTKYVISKLLPKRITSSNMLRRAANLLFTLVYLYFTGPLLANDFARSGIWLFEPIPISIFRGLGFGPGGKGEGWWCWAGQGKRSAWTWLGLWHGGYNSFINDRSKGDTLNPYNFDWNRIARLGSGWWRTWGIAIY